MNISTTSMNSARKARVRVLLVILMLVLANLACYCNKSLDAHERGLKLNNGEIQEVVSPGGRHWSFDPYTGFEVIDVSAKEWSWNDPDLVTEDEQPIGLSLNITVNRNPDPAVIEAMYATYNNVALDNNAMKAIVLARLPDAAKSATAQFTVGQMLGTESLREDQISEVAQSLNIPSEDLAGEGRQLLSRVIEILLQRDLDEVGLNVRNVAVTNVAPSEEFLALLERTANAIQEREAVIQERATNEERLESEQVQTTIEIEIAERERSVNEINARAYDTSPALLTIELTRILAEAINEGDVIIYIPEGSTLVNVVGQSGVLPILSSEIVEEQDEPDE